MGGVLSLVEAELRIPETSETLFGVESFTYHAYGNLTSRQTTEGGSSTTVNTPADATTNRLTGATSYDSEGNLTSWNGAQYGFDALGRMVRMQNGLEDWLFAYSAGGERVLQVDQGGAGDKRWTVRDVAGRVLREWIEPQGGSPAWERDWIYRGQNLLATIDATTTRHLTLDHLGTPRLVTDPSGARLAFKAYWPYGREATDPNQDELSKKFTGHERDGYGTASTADDLDYMHARFANPTTGRFLSVDPLGGSLSRPQSLNRFAYVVGNPVSAVDPAGLCSVLVWNGDPSGGDLQGALCGGDIDAGLSAGGANSIRGVPGGYVANDPLRKNPIGGEKEFEKPTEESTTEDPEHPDCDSFGKILKRNVGEALDFLKGTFGIEAAYGRGFAGALGLTKNQDGSLDLIVRAGFGVGLSGAGIAPAVTRTIAGGPAPTGTGVSFFASVTASLTSLAKSSFVASPWLRDLLHASPAAITASAHSSLKLNPQGVRAQLTPAFGSSAVAGLEGRVRLIDSREDDPCR